MYQVLSCSDIVCAFLIVLICLKKNRMVVNTCFIEVEVSSFIQLPLASDHKKRYLALYVLQKFIEAKWYKLPLQRVLMQRLPIYRTENNQQCSNGGLTTPRPHQIKRGCTFWAGAVGTGILYEMHQMLAHGPFQSSLHSSASTVMRRLNFTFSFVLPSRLRALGSTAIHECAHQ